MAQDDAAVYARRLAGCAPGTLRLVHFFGAAPVENLAHALRAVHEASDLIGEDRPADARRRLDTAHSLALASRQVYQLTTVVGEAALDAGRWLIPRAGQLQGGPARAWTKQVMRLAETLERARTAIREAISLFHQASVVLAVAGSTRYVGGSTKRRDASNAAKRYLTDANDRLVTAQACLAEVRAAAVTAIDATKLLLYLF